MKSFFKTILAKIKSIFTSPQTLASEAHAADLTLKILVPGLVLALQEAGVSEGSTQLTSIATEVETDLETVSTALEQVAAGQPVAPTIVSSLEAVKNNLAAIDTAAHIKNPTTKARVDAAVTAFINEAEVILGEFSAAGTASPSATSGAGN